MDSLKNKMAGKIDSLLALSEKINIIDKYLQDVQQGKRKSDSKIMEALQEIMSKLRRVESEEFNWVISRKSNDNYLALYIS